MSATASTPGRAGNADQAELGKFEALAHRFWDEHGEFRPLHLLNPVRAHFVGERVGLEGRRVLDVGCGGGLLSEALTRRGAQVTGIDLAPGMIEVARLHAREQQLSIDYRLIDAAHLAAATPGAFDVVVCMEMLEHVPDAQAMLRNLAELTRPGGAVFISTISRNLRAFLEAIIAAEYLLRLIPRGTHEYERLIRPSELARWGRTCGLGLEEIAGLALDPITEQVRLRRDPAVNYLAHFTRPAAGP